MAKTGPVVTALMWVAAAAYLALMVMSWWAGRGATESRQTRSIGYAVGAFLTAFAMAVVSGNSRSGGEALLWVAGFLLAWWASDRGLARLIAVGDAKRARTRRLFGLED